MIVSRTLLFASLFSASLTNLAEDVTICYNYDCASQASVDLREPDLTIIQRILSSATDAQSEREALAEAIGMLEFFTGEQAPTWADKGENIADDGVNGRMDCIDESRNTTTYLRLLEERGWIRYHHVLEPIRRAPQWINDHWAARIREKRSEREYAVDSWFFDNGQPAVIFPLQSWLKGARPHE